IEILEASSDTDINAAFAALDGLHVGALLVSPDPLFFLNQDRLVALASQHAIPAMYGWREFVVAGGLVSYALSIVATYPRPEFTWQRSSKVPIRLSCLSSSRRNLSW